MIIVFAKLRCYTPATYTPHATQLPPLPLTTFVHAARLPSTSSTCVRTCYRTSLVHTAIQHLYTLHVCRHYHFQHFYTLLLCCHHHRPAFIRIAKPHCYPLLFYICTCCSSAVYIVDLRSYALQNLVGTYCSPTFVGTAHMQSTPLTCVRMRCRTSSVCTAVLHSYMLRVCRHYRWLHLYVLLVCCQHRRPPFVRIEEPRWYTPLSYIRTRCTSDAITAGYIVGATRLPSASSTCIRTHCRTSLVHTTVLRSYTLHVCHHYCWLHAYALLVCRQHY